jgi:hypothetical protein
MAQLVIGYPRRFIELVGKVVLNGIAINEAHAQENQEASYINVFVEDPLLPKKRLVVITQEIELFRKAEMVVGYLLIMVGSSNRWFAINDALPQTTASKSRVLIREE